MEILAIIPARGGSKGIPHKNIISLAGKPLLIHSVDAALKAKRVTRVVVSTDDPEIAAVAKKGGADVVERPPEISGDSASSELALLHTLSALKDKDGYEPDLVVFLQCTSPLTTSDDIDKTVEKLITAGADTALAVAPFHYFLWSENAEGEAQGINHDKSKRVMRQENKSQYIEAGAVYVMDTIGFKKHQHRFFGKTVMYTMDEERCFEIDEPVDLIIAENMLLASKKQ